METKDIILELRRKSGLSQEELAQKVMVTRQAVTRTEYRHVLTQWYYLHSMTRR